MAQFYTDFSEYTTGVQPSDWTHQWATTSAYTAETGGGIGPKLLQQTQTSEGVTGLSWDDAGSSANVELLVKVRLHSDTAGIDYGGGAFIRGSGGSGSATAYHISLDYGGQVFRIGRNISGSYSGLATSSTFTFTYDQWVWYRFRVNGSSVQARAWLDGASEPGTWALDVTNYEITDAGLSGVYTYDGISDQYDWVGIGTNGDTAPGPDDVVDIAPAAAEITLTPYTPTTSLGPLTVAPTNASLSVTNYAPVVSLGPLTVAPESVNISIISYAPVVIASVGSITVNPASAAVSVISYVPEINITGDADSARLSQEVLETISSGVPTAAISQEVLETVSSGTPLALVSQEVLEAVASGAIDVNITQVAVELLTGPDIVVNVSRLAVEVLCSNAGWSHSVCGVAQPSAINGVASPSAINGIA